ncbi:MAG: hypothetical protein R2827_12865 [Bdellovibrionales bacterium]
MNYIIVLLGVVWSFGAFACPQLQGRFVCNQSGEDIEIVFEELSRDPLIVKIDEQKFSESDGWTKYTEQGVEGLSKTHLRVFEQFIDFAF